MELKATIKIILSYFETYKYTLARSVLTALSEFKIITEEAEILLQNITIHIIIKTIITLIEAIVFIEIIIISQVATAALIANLIVLQVMLIIEII